ncbi:hypothetical protein MVES1_000034 [Malassezia vespertilionis]|uniref:DUF866-domain-containing protein n=1 Tax=Malassezia vespertilionis TaxID=2020962 RepID=A0A2N1JGT7_9BASI|nr:uncharacterized protein MVES1_000034 [Malassezia vespertilionis]PKI85762.1 hypothetical protein MVES_000033 [Malassezia vespertilionis]WFD04710.1 hypothetical protein MVES1_000034 [Malassezia vespertilionis]
MPNLALQVRADFEGVTGLVPEDGVHAEIMFPVTCISCHETHRNPVSLDPAGDVEMQKGRGTANLVMSCANCRREMSASFIVPKPGSKKDAKPGEISPYHEIAPVADARAAWHTLCTVEFRGMNPEDAQVDTLLAGDAKWACRGDESGTPFGDVEFDEGEWHDYDDKAGDEVGITEVKLQWKRV